MPTPLAPLPLVPTPAQMRQWDAHAAALGIPPALLMENAAREALRVLRHYMPDLRGKKVLCCMGSGNNGGDAACLARHAQDLGAQVLVAHTTPLHTAQGATRQHIRMAKACGVPFARVCLPAGDSMAADADVTVSSTDKHKFLPAACAKEWVVPDVIVDGLLGTGFAGSLRPGLRAFIDYLNARAAATHAFVLALDVPSGCDAHTGLPSPVCLTAHATACLGAAKPGLVLPHAHPHTGVVHVCDIGMPAQVRQAAYRLLGATCAPLLPDVPDNAHKGSFGHVLVMGGSTGMYGAPQLTARAALRTGAGLVTLAVPAPPAHSLLPAPPPDIMTLSLHDAAQEPHGQWTAGMFTEAAPAIARASACAVGMGMGQADNAAAFVRALLAAPQFPPLVLDADACNLAARHRDILPLLRTTDIATPHPAEAARLLCCTPQEVQADRPAALRALCALAPCVWVLKGAGTLVGQQDAPTGILAHDIPALAVAGSGDVLSGCAAALLARGMHALDAAALAVSVHAHAGLLLHARLGARGGLASELLDHLPEALHSLAAMPEAVCLP